MPLFPGFVGVAYRARSRNAANEACYNLYLETTQSADEPKQGFLYGTPGLRPRAVAPFGLGCRGGYQINGRKFRVVGGYLYELTGASTAAIVEVLIGPIADDGLPVTFASNGKGGEQIAICGGGELKVFDTLTNTLSAAIVLPMAGVPTMVDFVDGYGLLLEADSATIWFSALEDFETWDALDFFTRSTTADNLVAMKVFRGKVWRLGSETSDVAYDTGDADNPFQPYSDSVMHVGCSSASTVKVMGVAPADMLFWLGQNEQGNASVMRAAGYSPADIGTPGLSFALGQYSTLADAEAFGYEQEEHSFYCLTFPSSPAGDTWVYDNLESGIRQTNVWHQRASWNTALGAFERWRARGFVAAFGRLLVGDYADGRLYELDLDYFFDGADGVIPRLRRAPYLSVENQWFFLDEVELGCETGVGLNSGQGSDPIAQLRVSRDSGATWDPYVDAQLGAMGEYGAECKWWQMGRARLDRLVMEVLITDPVKVALGPGLFLRGSPGTGQL